MLPVQHLSYFVEAAEGQQHQDGFGFLVDLGGAQVLRPALQHIRAFCRTQAHLEDTRHTEEAPSVGRVRLQRQNETNVKK